MSLDYNHKPTISNSHFLFKKKTVKKENPHIKNLNKFNSNNLRSNNNQLVQIFQTMDSMNDTVISKI
jgi:hypothetical protein